MRGQCQSWPEQHPDITPQNKNCSLVRGVDCNLSHTISHLYPDWKLLLGDYVATLLQLYCNKIGVFIDIWYWHTWMTDLFLLLFEFKRVEIIKLRHIG